MELTQKQQKLIATKLLAISRNAAGTLDETRVQAILEELPKFYVGKTLRAVLKFYYAVVAKELRFSEVRIEFVGKLPAGTAENLAEHFSKIYNRKIVPATQENSALLGGLRVSVGDDVIDASLENALKRFVV